MLAAHPQSLQLAYDPSEPLEAFRVRQRRAYDAGEQAWREGSINAQAQKLYNLLVRYVGAHRFCWVGEETLAAELSKDVSTIKRWIRQLRAAHLVRRERRYGHASLTFITAYDQTGAPSVVEQNHDVEVDTWRSHPTCNGSSGPSEAPVDAIADVSEAVVAPVAQSSGPTNASSISAFLPQDTLKDQELKGNSGGGKLGIDITNMPVEETAATDYLQTEGIVAPAVLDELKTSPLEQLEAVTRYVARCRSQDDPRRPGLIVHLLRRGFGRHGLSHRPGFLRDGNGTTSVSSRLPAGTGPFSQNVSVPSADGELCVKWRQGLDHVAARLPHDEYTTWLASNALLLLDGDTAVIGTANIFVRQEVKQRYTALLAETLSTTYGRPIAVEVVIGTAL